MRRLLDPGHPAADHNHPRKPRRIWRASVFGGAPLLVLAIAGCDVTCPDTQPPDQAHRVSVTEGVWGVVWEWHGALPLPDGSGCSSPLPVEPTERTILFFELTDSADTRGARPAPGGGVLYSEVLTPLIDSVSSDTAGFFQLSLPAGHYSALLRADSLLHWPSGGLGQDPVSFVEVVGGELTRLQIDVFP